MTYLNRRWYFSTQCATKKKGGCNRVKTSVRITLLKEMYPQNEPKNWVQNVSEFLHSVDRNKQRGEGRSAGSEPGSAYISRWDDQKSVWTRSTLEVAQFRCFVSERRGSSLARNRRNANLDFEKKRGFIDSGHGIIRRDAIWFLLKSVFRWGMELLKRGASEFLGWISIV